MEDQPGARRPGAGRHAVRGASRARARRRPGGGCRLCRRRSPPRARRHRVRSRGERDPRMARPRVRADARRRRSDRRASARTRGVAVTRDVAAAAQLACLLEVSAPNPGNGPPGASFRDVTFEDFLASAVAIGPALAIAGERPLGATIRAAVEATARWAPSNTNLGLVLLLAPLARAALRFPEGPTPLRARLAAVLADTTVADAGDAYAAIRLASPGGLGRVDEQDVTATPTATLRDVMVLARDRDAIAREYATDFGTTFDVGRPALDGALDSGLGWRDAVVQTYLTLLATSPDT